MLPHRLPAWAREQVPDEQSAMAEAQPSGVRLAFRTRATEIELDVLPTKTVYPGAPPAPRRRVRRAGGTGHLVAQATADGGNTRTIDLASGSAVTTTGPVATLRFDGLSRTPRTSRSGCPTTRPPSWSPCAPTRPSSLRPRPRSTGLAPSTTVHLHPLQPAPAPAARPRPRPRAPPARARPPAPPRRPRPPARPPAPARLIGRPEHVRERESVSVSLEDRAVGHDGSDGTPRGGHHSHFVDEPRPEMLQHDEQLEGDGRDVIDATGTRETSAISTHRRVDVPMRIHLSCAYGCERQGRAYDRPGWPTRRKAERLDHELKLADELRVASRVPVLRVPAHRALHEPLRTT